MTKTKLHKPDWCDEHVEAGVRDVVRFLTKRRFNTISSCEGGRGHPHKTPQVTISPSSERTIESTRVRLVRELRAAGYVNFCVTTASFYDDSAQPADLFVEVEFFDGKPARPRG